MCGRKSASTPSTVDEDVVALDLDGIFGETAVGRIDPCAGLGVERPLMGAAHDDATVELAFREGDVLVRADALEGADLAAFRPDQQNGVPSTSTSVMSPSQRSSSVQACLYVMGVTRRRK